MTCPAILTVTPRGAAKYVMGSYRLVCVKKVNHKGAHESELSGLPVDVEGAPGVWVAKIRL